MVKINLIVKKGDNPDCIHYEIIVGGVSTCKLCGQVRDYRLLDKDRKKGLYHEKSKKGGERTRARVSS